MKIVVQTRRVGHSRLREFGIYFWKHKYMYAMLLPAVVYYIIFHYIPMAGIAIAFEKFNPMKGMFASEWVGLQHFRQLFSQAKFYQVFWNTIRISLLRLFWGFPFPVIIALLLNELQSSRLKRTIQTAIYIPHFISWVVLGGILTNLLSTDGLFNTVIQLFGGQPIGFLTSPKHFEPVLIISMIWKSFGWTTIIYMAALSGVDPQLYEAAIVDGANRFEQLVHITLPSILSTIIVVLILRIGSLMQAGFEQIFVLYHPGVYSVSDIIDTYVYRIGLQEGKFEMAAAVGMFKSVINFVLVVGANKLARSFGEEGIY